MTTPVSPNLRTVTPSQHREGNPGHYTDERLVVTSKMNIVQKEFVSEKFGKFETSRKVESSEKKEAYDADKPGLLPTRKKVLSCILEYPFLFWKNHSTGTAFPPHLASDVHRMECAPICSDILDEPMAAYVQKTVYRTKMTYPLRLVNSHVHEMECAPVYSDSLDEPMAEFARRQRKVHPSLPSHLASAIYEMECAPIHSDSLDEPMAELSRKECKSPFPLHLASMVYEMECTPIHSDMLDEPMAEFSKKSKLPFPSHLASVVYDMECAPIYSDICDLPIMSC